METVEERQRRVALSGGRWEEYVRIYLNDKLKSYSIEVIYGKYEQQVKSKSQKLWEAPRLPVRYYSAFEESYVWGDLDLVAMKGDAPIAIISCKTSLHGRLSETLFWALVYRMLTKIKVVLATSDTGSGEKGKLRTEWGTPENPNQNRLLAEAFLDGVYVENVPEFCPELIEPTVFGGIVRPLSELPEDIKTWAEETSKFAYLRRSGRSLKDFV
jgi:hypothetical protein